MSAVLENVGGEDRNESAIPIVANAQAAGRATSGGRLGTAPGGRKEGLLYVI